LGLAVVVQHLEQVVTVVILILLMSQRHIAMLMEALAVRLLEEGQHPEEQAVEQ
jgi:hypothetical protein